MKILKSKSSFMAGFFVAVMLFACAGTALAATGTVSFNTKGLQVGYATIAKAGEWLKTESGAEVPSVILYTDEQGGGTHYIPVRELAELLELPLNAGDDYISLGVCEDLEVYTMPVTARGGTK